MKTFNLNLMATIIGLSISLDASLSNTAALGATLARSECKDYLSPNECVNFLKNYDRIDFDVMFKNLPIGQIGIEVLGMGKGSYDESSFATVYSRR